MFSFGFPKPDSLQFSLNTKFINPSPVQDLKYLKEATSIDPIRLKSVFISFHYRDFWGYLTYGKFLRVGFEKPSSTFPQLFYCAMLWKFKCLNEITSLNIICNKKNFRYVNNNRCTKKFGRGLLYFD